jgi:hypothetical protein
MTAQFHDSVWLEGDSWDIAGIDGGPLFAPEEHGITPGPMHTACYRGHVSTYEIGSDKQLRLVALLVSAAAKVDGRPLSKDDEVLDAFPEPVKGGRELVLEPLRLDVDFTGGLLVGRDWVPSKGANMGFQHGWVFSRVFDLALEHGRLLRSTDVSKEMARIRDAIYSGARPDPDGRRGSREWIDSRFTLDYRRSFGPKAS